MADFCITAVSYSPDGDHIEFVQVREEKQGFVGGPRVVPRAFVADLIRLRKASFMTRTMSESGGYAPGAHVHVIDTNYLTTDKNNSKRDNLGNLPEF